jgi:hypothetical protein
VRQNRQHSVTEFSFRQSEIKCFIEDPRRWYLNYYRNPNPRGQAPVPEYPGASEIGSMIHAGIYADYTGIPVESGVMEWMHEVGVQPDVPEWAKAAQKAITWAQRYVDWEAAEGIMVGTEILGAELELEVDVPGTRSSIYGQVDLAYRKYGELWVRDYKSGTQFRDLNPNDFQLWTYSWMVRATYNETVHGAEYARIRQATTSSKDLQDTVPTHLNDTALDNHERDLIRIVQEMESVVEYLEEGGDPTELGYNTTNDCGWKCNGHQAACAAMSYGEDWEANLQYPDGSPVGINQRGSTSE